MTDTPPPFDAELAGFQFRDKETKEFFNANAHEGMSLTLEREPGNKYDLNAVKVIFIDPDTGESYHVGYVESKVARELSVWLDQDLTFDCTLVEMDPHGKNRHVLRMLPVASDEELAEEFNENDLEEMVDDALSTESSD